MYVKRKKSGEVDLQDGTIEVYRPTKFEMSVNTTMERRKFEWTCYFADLLINKAKMQHGGTEGRRVRLHSSILKENVGKNYKSYLEAADSFGVVKRVDNYQIGNRSYGYEVGQGFTDDFTREPITNCVVRRRLFNIREKQEEAQRVLVEKFDRENLKRWLLSNLYIINYAPGEIPAGETEFATALRRIQATDMKENRWRARFDRYGRLHTNLTNLPRAMRGKLNVNGSNLVAVDIGASQPTFLCVLADEVRSGRITGTEKRRRGNAGKATPLSCTFFEDGSLVERLSKTAQCESWDRFRTDVESGALYENIRDVISTAESGKEITLSEAKRQTLMGIYIQANRNTPGVKALRQLYRGPHRFLAELKRTAVSDLSPSNDRIEGDEQAHCKASHCLQWIESTFIFDTVIARIMDERPKMFAATIHDAIVVEPENAAYVKGLMKEAFDEKGIAGRLKVEDLRS